MQDYLRRAERESHLDVYGLGKDRARWEATLQKFADCILQEHIRYFNEEYERNFDVKWREDLIKSMKQYYGVKE
jgi:hypothetical protein